MEVRYKKLLIVLLFILYSFICSSIILLKVDKIIVLKEDTVILSTLDEYKEPGYKANFLFFDFSNKVKVENNINYEKTGDYYVKYKLKLFLFEIQKERKVIIKDTTKPVITLKGEEEVKICPNKTYEEEGYEAVDNIDGDITEKVKKEEKENSIIYYVKDSSGNKEVKTRNIKKEDTESPTIHLKGNTKLYLTQGETYKEPGYEAKDNCDGDLTNKVKVSGYVNSKTIGTYTLTYIVKDNSGNETIQKRTVYVEKKQTGGIIYLTFDDGPSRSITPKVLDILKEENVKATFFVIHHDKSLNQYIKRAYEEGHTIALHSYTHNYKKIYASVDAYFEDLNKIREEVHNITGHYANIIRFPGGSSNTVSKFNPKIMTTLAKQVEEKGFIYFDWNISSGDAGGAKTKNDIYNNVIRSLTRGTNIVLMHDKENNYITLNALKDIIQYAKIKGYKFERITEGTKQIHHPINN